jgi:hypothetical protein
MLGPEPAGSTTTSNVQPPPPSEDVTVTTVVPTGKNEFEAELDETSPHVPTPSALENVTNAPGFPF